jgi:hypothetical protein
MSNSALKTVKRRMGKSQLQEKIVREYVRRNPQAVVARVTAQGTIIEKPVDGEIVGLDLLPPPKP